MRKKVIVLEFNELAHELIFKFMGEDHLPNFKKLHDSSQVYTTDSQAQGEDLNPWVQWVTVHSGLNHSEHKVTTLNQVANCEYIWDSFSRAGLKSWICGSMNTSFKEGFKGMLVPDPWSAAIPPHPKGKFDPFFNFISQSVQSHAHKGTISSKDFIIYMLKNGLSIKTTIKLAKQLLSERFNKSLFWKRACLLDWLQLDLFIHHFKKDSPDFSTFFSNSTAHFQHHYWADMDPEVFNKTKDEVRQDSKDSILIGYKNHDAILERIFKLADDDTVIVFCTALSQQPYKTRNPEDERHYYHMIDEPIFKEKLGISIDYEYAPVMADQFHLKCRSPEDAANLNSYLEKFDMDSGDYFHVGSNRLFLLSVKEDTVYVQCRCTKIVNEDAMIINNNSNTKVVFSEVFYHMDDVKAGEHNPLGMLWIHDKNQAHAVNKDYIELEKVAPLLKNILLPSAA